MSPSAGTMSILADQASQCKLCKQNWEEDSSEVSQRRMIEAVYIGESARQIGTRAMEHINKAWNLKKDSFILEHWMLEHPTRTSPPEFSFKILSVHKDALSRQIREAVVIKDRGKLNKRDEFAINELIRLEASKYAWDEAEDARIQRRREKEHQEKLSNFIHVMKIRSQNQRRKSWPGMLLQ